MKLQITKTLDIKLKEIEDEIEQRWIDYILGKAKELNNKVITMKVTKKKTLKAIPLSLDKPTFRLFCNNKDFGIWFKKGDKWLVD